MTEWSRVFLGIIAAAVLVMAVIQVGAVVAAPAWPSASTGWPSRSSATWRRSSPTCRRRRRGGARLRARRRSRSSAPNRLFADVSARVEETTAVVQQAIMAPAREGMRS